MFSLICAWINRWVNNREAGDLVRYRPHYDVTVMLSNELNGALEYHTNILQMVNTLRPRRNRRYFADDIFKCIFVNENVWISIKISLKFIPKGPINHYPSLVQIMAWRRPGDKPLSETMMVRLLTHICVTRPQWVNQSLNSHKNDYEWLIEHILTNWMFIVETHTIDNRILITGVDDESTTQHYYVMCPPLGTDSYVQRSFFWIS